MFDLPSAPPPSLSEIQTLSLQSASAVPLEKLKDINATRAAALREVALGAGARAGLEARNYEITVVLGKHESQLDAIYNFRALMLEANVLPPVLVEGENLVTQESAESIRIVDEVYKIQAHAKFVTAPPNWREYIYKVYPAYAVPHHSLLPQTNAEQAVWKVWVAEGWANGLAQADSIYADGLSRLKRDYEGMVRYRTLHAQGKVSRPFVSQSHFGVTGNRDNLNINEQTLRITAQPGFEIEPEKWAKPAVDEPVAATAPRTLIERKPFVDNSISRPEPTKTASPPKPVRTKGRT